MAPAADSDDPAAPALALAARSLSRPTAPFPELPGRFLLVDADRQRLFVIERGRAVASYLVSTAAAGIGGAEDSQRTPPGWHRVHARIGGGAPIGATFESREPTGAVWRGEPVDDDLILTRVLTLEGLEDGINRGAGVDSLARYVYVHGTNHPDLLGRPTSHGCIRMANDDVVALFDRVAEGEALVVVGTGEVPDPRGPGRFHYAGLGGSGMSALAQFQVMIGGRASGSDRAFDRGERADARAKLERLGIRIVPQDGRGIDGDCSALVVSTAVEEDVADVAAARARAVPIVHRSDVLARFVADHRTIAIAGTSGKSTTVAMAFEILEGAGRRPSVITGGDLSILEERGLWGNAWSSGSDLLVVEADESDGSLVKYRPAIGVVLNLQRDHKEESEVARMFATFRERTRERLIVGEGENLAGLAAGALVFGFGPQAEVRGESLELSADRSRFTVGPTAFELPTPGRHNVENALAAIAACHAAGVPIAAMAGPLAGFRGVGRRFQVVGRSRGIEVIDDFAHNPAKLEAALATAQRRAGRVLAVYQPHGYGPTRFLRRDFVDSFVRALRPQDRLWMLEVFYAGGSAQRDFSAADLVAEIAARGARAEFAPSRSRLVERLATEAREGDLVLVMGARDPSLSDLARSVHAALAPSATA
jgi:UDP-N-acetylmuramate--alanine ligase